MAPRPCYAQTVGVGKRVELATAARRTFDVICAGETAWHFGMRLDTAAQPASAVQFQSDGGALNVAVALATWKLRVGLVTALSDDSLGRALGDRLARAGVDVGGVRYVAVRPSLVATGGTGAAFVAAEQRDDLAVPAGFSARVLLLSSLSPEVAHAAAFCRAARAARNAGTTVVVAVNARRQTWAGHDPRRIRAVLREADVVCCGGRDFAALGADESTFHAALRPTAVLVVNDATGVRTSGGFGMSSQRWSESERIRSFGASDVVTAAICAELANREPDLARADLWERAFDRARRALPALVQSAK